MSKISQQIQKIISNSYQQYYQNSNGDDKFLRHNFSQTSSFFKYKQLKLNEIINIIMKSNHAFYVFTLCNMFVAMSGSLITPFFPPYALSKGISKDVLGYIIAANPIGSFIASILIGKYLKEENRALFLMIGVLGEPFSLMLIALTSLFDDKATIIAISATGRFFGGIGTSMFVTPFFGMIPLYYPDDVQMKVSISESFNGLGMFAGPILGSLIYSVGGYISPFIAFSTFGILVLPFLYYAIKAVQTQTIKIWKENLNSNAQAPAQPLIQSDNSTEFQSSQAIQNQNQNSTLGYTDLLTHYPVVVTFWNIFVINVCFTYFQPILAIYYDQQYGIGPDTVGYVLTIVTSFYILGCYLTGKVTKDKYKRIVKQLIYVQTVFVGLLSFGVSFMFIGPDSNLIGVPHLLWVSLVAQAVLGITTGPAYIPSMPLLNEFLAFYYPDCKERTSTLSSAVLTSGMALGQLSGPIISGHLDQIFGFERTCSIIGFVLIFSGIIYIPVLFYNKNIRDIVWKDQNLGISIPIQPDKDEEVSIQKYN
ncbi:hypothetical protein pb186bvf_004190 [Paramecium bursaria]